MPVTRSMQERVETLVEESVNDTSLTATGEAGSSQTTTSQVTIEEAERAGHRPSQPRSRRSSKKSSLWAARERLAKAKMELAEIALQRVQAGEDSSDEEDGEQSELASVRISKWLQQRPGEGPSLPANNLEKIPGEAPAEEDLGARERQIESQPDRVTNLPAVKRPIGLEELTAALSQIATKRDSPRYLHELPVYNGQVSGWLAFKAAFRDSESTFSKAENVARMRKSLKGAAYEAVSSLMVGQPDPGAVMEALERRFGRPEALVLAEMEKLRHLPKVSDSAREVCVFAGRVANAVATVQALGREAYLHSPEMVRGILEKLTPILRNKWYDYAAIKGDNTPKLKMISAFLNDEADKCGAYALPEATSEDHSGDRKTKKKVERAYAAVQSTNDDCPDCNKVHKLIDCPNFTSADVSAKWAMARKHRICFLCLTEKHRRFKCKANTCKCGKSHHPVLHVDPQPEPAKPYKEIAACTIGPEEHRGRQRHAYLKVAPIELVSPSAKISTYALLDDGSTCTFIEESIAELLGVDGPSNTLWIRDANGGEVEHKNSKRVNVQIRGRHGEREHVLREAQTVKTLNFITQTVSTKDLEGCHHLTSIKDSLVYNNARPKVIIGQNNWNLITSNEVRKGRDDQPVASLTHLGWVLHGCRYTDEVSENGNFCGYVYTAPQQLEEFDEKMKDFFKLESLGIQEKKPVSDPEQRAVRLLEEKSRRLPDGRFETGLLWRDDNVVLRNNYEAARKRLLNLERKLDKDEDLKIKYNERINNLLVSGYAERAVSPPTPGKTWYLPHFAVVNPAKPKIRIVHDAAAKLAGKNLNDMLLTGPDLLQSLPGVIMRFRQYPYAVSADIKEMFMQVRILPQDRDALRFLWRGDKRGEDAPEEFRMTSVIFGASSSPCTALFIKNRNARDFAQEYPDAASAIEKNHYMDDYLISFQSIKSAERVNKEVDFIHRQACFELRGWASNERRTISALTAHSKDPTVSIGGSDIEKALGLLWNVTEDYIGFKVNTAQTPAALREGSRPPTKREALSIIMSLFDPLGLISPVTTPAKRLMQDTWRHGIGWDDQLPDELTVRWQCWYSILRKLNELRIPRCYDYEPASTRQMHTFVDASEEAYATAVYWRITRADGSVHIALAAAKSRVTPLKPISIPRLELQAALLGTRLADTVIREHDFKVTKRIYWSDSRTALAWIRAEPRAFKTFVAHRLAEIEETTKKTEWRWVPTKDNVADDSTRATPERFDAQHRWFTGPDFLHRDEATWPTETPMSLGETGEEKCLTTIAATVDEPRGHMPDIERFSKWLRLIRATARVLQFIALCRRKKAETVAALRKHTWRNKESDTDWKKTRVKKQPRQTLIKASPKRKLEFIGLEAHFLIRAEQLWVMTSQRESFGEDFERVKQQKSPSSCGRLAALSVAMGTDGTLRLRGRISRTPELAEETASPAVLDGKHKYTRLYIQHVHRKLHHGGVETVVNELRQRAWIVKIRPAVKDVIKGCLYCRIRKAKPGRPATGDLPKARLAHHMRAFTYTGLDYFGPLHVTVGRHTEKRYVALFTCMTSRAIHLEVVGSLSADSAICALRRFIARRGCPREMISDNATCFKAADRELRAALLEAVEEEVNSRHITWRYIPPAAPFMGGAWERMVRSVKEALNTTLHQKNPKEETLATLLTEVEATVNSRPLTHVAVDPDDLEALTPNHLLLGPNSHIPAPGAFSEDDDHARQHWRRIQRLADEFWRRWLREYLPILQHRREPRTTGESPKVGDLVVICDENLPRNTWPRGRITALHPGRDGVVRVVDVTTSAGHVLRRPTRKIVVLPVRAS